MAPLVRVRDWMELRRHVLAAGRQVDIATQAGMSLQRLNQLVTGTAIEINVWLAGQLEDVLGVPRGTFFVAASALAPYVATDEPPSTESPASAPASGSTDQPTV